MTKVFVPDPGRWAAITVGDWFTVFDVLGWRYDPETESSELIVATRSRGIGVLKGNSHALVPRWDGIRFGHGPEVQAQKDTAPVEVQRAHEFATDAWLKREPWMSE